MIQQHRQGHILTRQWSQELSGGSLCRGPALHGLHLDCLRTHSCHLSCPMGTKDHARFSDLCPLRFCSTPHCRPFWRREGGTCHALGAPCLDSSHRLVGAAGLGAWDWGCGQDPVRLQRGPWWHPRREGGRCPEI
jgi:hypothetical protein